LVLKMKFEKKLLKGTLVKRYKRFFADITLEDGTLVTAHCPNTGRMTTCGTPGDTVFIQPNDNPKRKLKFTWELTKTKGGYIGVNTVRPNHIVFEGLENGLIKELKGYDKHLKEKKYGNNSRIDILLEKEGGQSCYVEVKNTTLLQDGNLVFPDAVTERGLKHLVELSEMVKQGHRAVMFYLCNRPEGDCFSPATEVDPEYCKALLKAHKNGVEVLAYRATHTLSASKLGKKLKIKL
jgi:sugar fermentation stimulation protein A